MGPTSLHGFENSAYHHEGSTLWPLHCRRSHECIRTPEEAHDVWAAVPEVLGRCKEQATYEEPEAASAYAWLHLLDRYVRTWLGLERLVQNVVHTAGLAVGERCQCQDLFAADDAIDVEQPLADRSACAGDPGVERLDA